MARLARLSLPSQVHYVRVYGAADISLMPMLEDLDAMLSLFSKVVSLHHVDMTGYAILPSQIDFLITPRNSAEDVSKFTQAFCRLYSRYFNDAYRRSGALWHGRFRSCVVQGKNRCLNALLYMEWLPETKGYQEAVLYPWSSYSHHAGLRNDYFMAPGKEYWGLGNTPFERQKAYKVLFPGGYPKREGEDLEKHLIRGWPWADREFLLENHVEPSRIWPERGRARPRKSEISD